MDHQVPPDTTDWWLWLLQSGRGAGKTAGAAYYLDRYMTEHPGHRAGIIAPTLGDAVESCFRGETGLQAFNPTLKITGSLGRFRVLWPNGSVALLFGAYTPEDVERLRAGGNRHVDWWEELATWRKLDQAIVHARLGLRLGDRPHALATTTPKPRAAYRQLMQDPGCVISTAAMDDNPYLTDAYRQLMYEEYGGTHLGRQELEGIYSDEVEGALWKRAWIDRGRITWRQLPPLARIVVSIDPSEGKQTSDEQAIAVCALGLDHDYYVLHTEGVRLSPLAWCRRAAALVRHFDADRLVYEGGAWVADLLGQVDDELPLRPATTSRSKKQRAEPVAALWEKDPPRAHMVEDHPEAEDQMTTFTGAPGESSPDRLDAIVHGINELRGSTVPVGVTEAERPKPKELGYGIDALRAMRRRRRERDPIPGADRELRW